MELTLPSELERWVAGEVASGRFPSPDAVIATALQLLIDEADAPPSPRSAEEIIASLQESDDDIHHGRTMPVDAFLAQTWARIGNYRAG